MYVLSDPRIFDPKIPSIPICPIHNQIGSILFLNSIKAHLKFLLYPIRIVIKPTLNFKFEIYLRFSESPSNTKGEHFL